MKAVFERNQTNFGLWPFTLGSKGLIFYRHVIHLFKGSFITYNFFLHFDRLSINILTKGLVRNRKLPLFYVATLNVILLVEKFHGEFSDQAVFYTLKSVSNTLLNTYSPRFSCNKILIKKRIRGVQFQKVLVPKFGENSQHQ